MSGSDVVFDAAIEVALRAHLPRSSFPEADRLNRALHYAVFPGGKRFRPKLTIYAARLLGDVNENVLASACGVEFVHASSLIIDDLPSMDNACTRRGKPAVHVAYGEDIALLAALALLNASFEIFSMVPQLVKEAAECIGVSGMIGGQAVDVSRVIGSSTALSARNQKTTALMRLTLSAGALVSGASETEVRAVGRTGECLGAAYQIYDDFLDMHGRTEETGKPAGQDHRHERLPPATEGPSACRHRITLLLDEAHQCLLGQFGAVRSVEELMSFVRTFAAR